MRFQNPANGYIETASSPWLWCLLFGFIYFAAKGIWTHAIASLAAALVTAGISWFIYPFFARNAVRTHYLREGWKQVD